MSTLRAKLMASGAGESKPKPQAPERIVVPLKPIDGQKLKSRLRSFGVHGPTVAALSALDVYLGRRAITPADPQGRASLRHPGA
jgi:hypothetical protein